MIQSNLLTWQDIAKLCHCGRNKALKIVHALNPIYIGRTPLVPVENYRDHILRHGEIKVEWDY